VNFEWDAAKDRSNRTKHGLSFSEVVELFRAGRDYLEIFDAAHSETEDRFIAIGEIRRGVAVVVYTERDEDRIRIIGSRFATPREWQKHRQYMDQSR
jgi:uncharacterized DUF497 family protein